MSKAILISIRPKWCEKIANGEESIVVIKTCPKIKTPFKCYIYCTMPKFDWEDYIAINIGTENARDFFGGGKVIGEFICDSIYQYESEFYSDDSVLNAVRTAKQTVDDADFAVQYELMSNEDVNQGLFEKSICMNLDELKSYIGTDKVNKTFYGWHISDLVIYDKPKKLSEFMTKPCDFAASCGACVHSRWDEKVDYHQFIGCSFDLKRPPQSWCYVEELK